MNALRRDAGADYCASMHGATRYDPRVSRWNLPDDVGWCGATIIAVAAALAAPRLLEHERRGAPEALTGPMGPGKRIWGTGIGRAGWADPAAMLTEGDAYVIHHKEGMHVGLYIGPGTFRDVELLHGLESGILESLSLRRTYNNAIRAPRVWNRLSQSPYFWQPEYVSRPLTAIDRRYYVSWDGNGPGGVCGFNLRELPDRQPTALVSWHGAFRKAVIEPVLPPRSQQPRLSPPMPLDNPLGEGVPRHPATGSFASWLARSLGGGCCKR
jgi:hypothetical protein